MKNTYNNSKYLSNNTISYGTKSNQTVKKDNKQTSSKTFSNINPNHQQTVEDDFITNLQKQIYYLELEMKLMKDREIETKNKVGGYEILFRDGVPLNEHFLALKTKYTNERDAFDAMISKLEHEVFEITNENNYYIEETKQSQKSYFDLQEKRTLNEEAYENRIIDLTHKLINEKNLLVSHFKDKEKLGKQFFQINSQNAHINRTIEKNNLFKEDKEDKNIIAKEKLIQKFNEVDALVERSLLEEQSIKRKYEKSSQAKIIEDENSQMIFQINKIDRDVHLSLSKINELENMRELNMKYLKDEAINRKIHEKDNQRLNLELENLGKLNEENLKIKVKENEEKQLLIIQNKIKNSELKMNTFLQHYKESEKEARELLEDKNNLQQQLAQLIEESDNRAGKEEDLKKEIIEYNNDINNYEQQIQEKLIKAQDFEEINTALFQENERLEQEIKDSRINLDELLQKVELNNILKDVDVNELKMLTQNNAVVNQSINLLMSKWDKVHTKLQQIENIQKAKN